MVRTLPRDGPADTNAEQRTLHLSTQLSSGRDESAFLAGREGERCAEERPSPPSIQESRREIPGAGRMLSPVMSQMKSEKQKSHFFLIFP